MLELKSLACQFGTKWLFRDVCATIPVGGMWLVIGENGAGKTTLLRQIAGLMVPSVGQILWNGKVLGADFHYLGHLDGVKGEFTAQEMMDYWCALAGRDAPDGTHVGILRKMGLGGLQNKPIRHFSAGQRRRLALGRLLIWHAPIWILDEPMVNLDDAGQKILADMVAHHRKQGGIIVMASHQEISWRGVTKYILRGVR